MIKQFFCGLSICLFLFSCDQDSSVASGNNSDIVITGYKINSKSDYSDASGSGTYQNITIGNIVNNKLFSESSEKFLNGVSQGVLTEQNYFYSNGLLTMRKVGDDKKDFFYDAGRNLIGINWTKLSTNGFNPDVVMYYRFSYHPDNIVFVERITLPYDNPAATIERRSIVQLDSNDNIVKAGRDYDLNGVMDAENQFFYENDNLTSIQKSNGDILTFAYSNVIDNFMVLNYNSYGKKVFRLLESEWHAMIANDTFDASRNLKGQEILDANYEVLSTNYYKKKTRIQISTNAQTTTTTEFFFQE